MLGLFGGSRLIGSAVENGWHSLIYSLEYKNIDVQEGILINSRQKPIDAFLQVHEKVEVRVCTGVYDRGQYHNAFSLALPPFFARSPLPHPAACYHYEANCT